MRIIERSAHMHADDIILLASYRFRINYTSKEYIVIYHVKCATQNADSRGKKDDDN